MNGVVFQISEIQMAITAGTVSPNQLKLSSIPGIYPLTNPLVALNANCQEKPDTTVMMP